MNRTAIIVISIFVALCIGGIVLSIRNSAKERQRVARYAAFRRGTVLGLEEEEALQRRLNKMTPDMRWTATTLVQVEPPPRGVYFFGFQQSSRGGRSSASYGYACFAERALGQPGKAVEIDPRVPLLSNMLDNRVETGSPEFRQEYTVTCRDPAVAQGAVNAEVQRILLDHVASRKWGVSVILGAEGVLVNSPHAKEEPDWDYITAMAIKLREALD